MKRFLFIIALLLVPTLALAGSNIKQKDTGATVWENAGGDQVPVGNPGLTIFLEEIQTARTAYAVTHKSGNIVKIYSVTMGGGENSPNILDFGTSQANGIHIAVSAADFLGTLTIASAISQGEIDSVSYTPGTDFNIAVSAGDAVYVHTDGGGSTGGTDVIVTIIIE